MPGNVLSAPRVNPLQEAFLDTLFKLTDPPLLFHGALFYSNVVLCCIMMIHSFLFLSLLPLNYSHLENMGALSMNNMFLKSLLQKLEK